MLMNIHIPHEPFNTAVKEGTVGATLSRIMEETKPQAVYFTEQNGTRGLFMVVDVANPSQIPSLAEPWFLNFNADCEFRVAMTPEDLRGSGLDELGKKWE
jgi:hypothetical protein